jgi:hypothetical protein
MREAAMLALRDALIGMFLRHIRLFTMIAIVGGIVLIATYGS